MVLSTEQCLKICGSREHYTSIELFEDMEFPVRIMRCKDHPYACVHTHDFYEFVYVSHGIGRHITRLKDTATRGATNMKHTNIIKGDLFSILPGEAHGYSETRSFRIYNILFLPEFINNIIPGQEYLQNLYFLINRSVHDMASGKLYIHPEFQEPIENSLSTIISEMENKRSGFQEIVNSRFKEFLIYLSRSGQMHKKEEYRKKVALEHDGIRRAVGFIEENLHRSISLSDVADAACLSPEYLSVLFKRKTGASPWDFINHSRIEKAKDHLKNTNEPVTQIAYKSGFSDSSYFTKVFRKYTGLPPSDYRKSLK